MCICRICQRNKKIDAFFLNCPLPQKDTKWLTETFNLLYEVEADLEYKNCILQGDWPSSVEQLERALEQAREKRILQKGD